MDKLHLKKEEKVESGCSSWRFSHVFYFKIGSKNQKLLTNGILQPKNVSDLKEPRNVDMLSTGKRKSRDIEGKQQMEIHMDYEKSPISMPFGVLLKNHKKAMTPSKRISQKPLYHFKDEIFQSLTSSDKLIISEMFKEFLHNQENGADNTWRNVISPLNQYEMQILQMRAKAFTDKMFIDRIKNSVNRESKPPFEGGDVLNLNMDLFLKVVQDPYPVFVNNIKNLRILPRKRGKTMETKDKDANSLRAKGEFGNVSLPKSKVKQTSEDVSCHCSSHQKSLKKNKGQIKRGSFSSLKGIFTRKNRENKNDKVDQKPIEMQPKNDKVDHKPIEMQPKNEKVDHKPIEMQPKNEKVDMKKQKVDIFIEAKRRLSERLKCVDTGEIKEAPRTLKMILSSRDSDISESNTLKGHHNFDSEQERYSLYRNHEIVKTEQAEEDTSLFVPENTKLTTPSGLKCYDDMEVDEAINGGSYKTRESCEDSGYIERLNLTTTDDYSSDSTTCLDAFKLQTMEKIEEKEEFTSPVSVLEPFCFESELQPHCLNFEDTEQDPVSLYVRTILEVSGLNLDEFSIKEPLHLNLLQSYIPSEVDSDIKILLDCVLEALTVVYEGSFECYPWKKVCLKPKFKVVQGKERFIEEVVKEVNFVFGFKAETLTVNQIVMKDTIAGFSSWIDLRDDAEHIIVQLAEDVMGDLVLNAIFEI